MRVVSCPTGRTTMTSIGAAAVYVDKILKGAKPADLPVQQATKFEFVINLKAAKQIGLTFSPNVLSRANQVIKQVMEEFSINQAGAVRGRSIFPTNSAPDLSAVAQGTAPGCQKTCRSLVAQSDYNGTMSNADC